MREVETLEREERKTEQRTVTPRRAVVTAPPQRMPHGAPEAKPEPPSPAEMQARQEAFRPTRRPTRVVDKALELEEIDEERLAVPDAAETICEE